MFIELRDVDETTSLLRLDGLLPLAGHKLRIRRPTNYNAGVTAAFGDPGLLAVERAAQQQAAAVQPSYRSALQRFAESSRVAQSFTQGEPDY
jgi:hypothetical protein